MKEYRIKLYFVDGRAKTIKVQDSEEDGMKNCVDHLTSDKWFVPEKEDHSPQKVYNMDNVISFDVMEEEQAKTYYASKSS